MTTKEAKDIAKLYVSQMGEVLPGFKFGIGDEEDFTDRYYFDLIWLTPDNQPVKDPPAAGGNHGLTVDKLNGKAGLTTHGGYAQLKDKERHLTDTLQLFVDFKTGKTNLAAIKAKFHLDSKQLLELSRVIKETELSRENVYEIINRLIDKVKNTPEI